MSYVQWINYYVYVFIRIQAGSQPITSVAWLPALRLVATLSKDGALQVWKTRVVLNPNRAPMQANFFEPAGKKNLELILLVTNIY